jgi:hypothetical protein
LVSGSRGSSYHKKCENRYQRERLAKNRLNNN